MNLNEYQVEASRTSNAELTPRDEMAAAALGLTGEAGEAAELIKKHLFHGHPLDRDRLRKELGDVLWYVAALAGAAGLTLEEVAQHNIDKLRARYPEGFSAARSQARVDEPPDEGGRAVVIQGGRLAMWGGEAPEGIAGVVLVEADAPRLGVRRLTDEEDARLAAELRAPQEITEGVESAGGERLVVWRRGDEVLATAPFNDAAAVRVTRAQVQGGGA